MTLDSDGHTRGAAFVEFEEEVSPDPCRYAFRLATDPRGCFCFQSAAKAALALNSHELKKRRIAVTLADNRGHAGGGPKR